MLFANEIKCSIISVAQLLRFLYHDIFKPIGMTKFVKEFPMLDMPNKQISIEGKVVN